jgi:hypothetical protein
MASVRRFESGVWVEYTPAVKVRLAGAWVPAPLRYWDGSTWVELTVSEV